jgi:hypothetical protein
MSAYNPRGKKSFDYGSSHKRNELTKTSSPSILRTFIILVIVVVPLQIFNEYRINSFRKNVELAVMEGEETWGQRNESLKRNIEDYKGELSSILAKSQKNEAINQSRISLVNERVDAEKEVSSLLWANKKDILEESKMLLQLFCKENNYNRSENIKNDTLQKLLEGQSIGTLNKGWVYIGKYTDGSWTDTFFKLHDSPDKLENNYLISTKESVNVRKMPPTDDQDAGEIVGNILAKSVVKVIKTKTTGSLQGTWGLIEFESAVVATCKNITKS